MSGFIRQINSSDGAPITAPTTVTLSSASLIVYANDAAYEAVHGAGQQGDKYFNSTELLEREHDGTGWVYVNKALTATTDSSTTGADNDLSATRFDLLRFTEGSLASIRSIDPAQHKIIYMVNDQAGSQTITWKNEDGAATAANRVVTGTGDNVIQEVGQTLVLVYDTEASRWRIAGGTGSGGGGLEIEVITNAESPVTGEIGKWYVTDTSSGTININLPDLSAIPGSQEASASIRVSDCKNNWHINKVTLTPFSGDSIDGNATDEVMDLDVEGQYVWVARESATSWCFDTNIQPTEAGTTGTGTGFKNYVKSPDTADDVASTGGAVANTHTTIADLPENETKTTGTLCTITAGSIGNTSTWDTFPVDNADDGKNGSPDGYWKTMASYADGAASLRWINTDTSEVMFTYVIPADSSGRISDVVVDQAILTAGENTKPQIYWNVTSETNGLVLSGMGTIPETRLTGALVTDPESYLPVYQGFGTVTDDRLEYTLIGKHCRVQGEFNPGALSGVIARIGLPNNWTVDFVHASSATPNIVGMCRQNQALSSSVFNCIATHGDTYINISRDDDGSSANGLSPVTDTTFGSSVISIDFIVPIAEVDGSVMFGTEAQGQNSRTRFYLASNTAYTANTAVPFDTISTRLRNLSGINNTAGTFSVDTDGDYEIKTFVRNSTSFSSAGLIRIYKNGSIESNIGSMVNTQVPAYGTDTIYLETTDTFSIRLNAAFTAVGGEADTWVTITRVADKSSKATGFPFADQHPGEYGTVKVNQSQEKTLGSPVSGASTDIITFNNLVIGQRYLLKGVLSILTGSNQNANFDVADGTNTRLKGLTAFVSNESVTASVPVEYEFIAANSVIKTRTAPSFGGSSSINPTTAGTNASWLRLTAINNTIETTDFT